jgi:hypothetical protein
MDVSSFDRTRLADAFCVGAFLDERLCLEAKWCHIAAPAAS